MTDPMSQVRDSEDLLIDGARIPGGPVVRVVTESGRVTAIEPLEDGPGHGAAGGEARAGRRIDATGTWVMPGFIDAHVHLVMAGLGLQQLDLSGVRDRASFEAAIGRRAADLPADAWLVARGWDESQWGGEMPTRAWLAAAGDRPAVAWRMDIHAAVVNQAVLDRCDLREPVEGGTIVRDAAGAPTGLLLEAAAWARLNPEVPEPTVAEETAAVAAAEAYAHRRGIVAVGAMEYLDVAERALLPTAHARTLRMRLIALDRELPLNIARMRSARAADIIRTIAAKAFIDGTLGSRTARMLAPYADRPDERGMLVELAASGRLHDWATQAAQAGFGVAMHAIGDEAVSIALDVAETARHIDPRGLVRIEHAQHVDPADHPRFDGLIASVQPAHRIGDHAVMAARLGAARAAAAFPFSPLAAAGATLAFGSDWPVIDCDPRPAIAAAVHGAVRGGRDPSGHEVSIRAALAAHTVGAAAAIGEPDGGRLAEGGRADLVLVDADPLTADWAAAPPAIALTVAGGRVVHEA